MSPVNTPKNATLPTPWPLGTVVRNMTEAAEMGYDNPLHLYLLAGPDYSESVIKSSNPELWPKAEQWRCPSEHIHRFKTLGVPALLRLGDLSLGERRALGSCKVSEEEMLRYARAFDPQAFHVDLDAARLSHFGGLVASGWFTVSVYTRLLVDGLLSHLDTVGSPGAEHVSWPAPLRPGVTMTGDVEVRAIRPSLADRGIGVVGLDGRGLVDGAEVLRISIAVLVAERLTPPVRNYAVCRGHRGDSVVPHKHRMLTRWPRHIPAPRRTRSKPEGHDLRL